MPNRVGVAPLIEEVVASLNDRLASMKVAIKIEDEDQMICCDRQLMVMLLTQYIDNACKYSHLWHHHYHPRGPRQRRGDFFRP